MSCDSVGESLQPKSTVNEDKRSQSQQEQHLSSERNGGDAGGGEDVERGTGGTREEVGGGTGDTREEVRGGTGDAREEVEGGTGGTREAVEGGIVGTGEELEGGVGAGGEEEAPQSQQVQPIEDGAVDPGDQVGINQYSTEML